MGPNGGSLAAFDGSLHVEIKPVDATTWELLFLKEAMPIEPLAVEAVVV
jgi:hypothetical protein